MVKNPNICWESKLLGKISWIKVHGFAKDLKIIILNSINEYLIKKIMSHTFDFKFELVKLRAPIFDVNFDLDQIWIKIFDMSFDLVKYQTWAKIFDLTFD